MTLSDRLGSRADITAGVITTFRTLSRHPHPSHHEEAVGQDYMEFLRGLGLSPVRDEAGNVMADCPATPAGRTSLCSSSRATWTWCAPWLPAAGSIPSPIR